MRPLDQVCMFVLWNLFKKRQHNFLFKKHMHTIWIKLDQKFEKKFKKSVILKMGLLNFRLSLKSSIT